jgi:hypothetical protein
MKHALMLVVALAPEAGAAPPCDGAPQPAIGKVAAESTSVGPATVAITSDGDVVFTVTGYGSFKIPSKTATSSSDHTEVRTTWAFRLAKDKLETIGEVSRTGGGFVTGTGTPIVHAGNDVTACAATGKLALPAHGDAQTTAMALDGGTLALARAQWVKTTDKTCKGMVASVSGSQTLSLETLDPSASKPAWKSLATRTAGPVNGKGCRAVVVEAAAATATAAAFAVSTCEVADGGDYMAHGACAVRVEAWIGSAWASAELPVAQETNDSYVVSVDGGVARIAAQHDDKTRVYRLDHGKLVVEGDELDGYPHVLSGTRLAMVKLGGKRTGSIGNGWQLQVRELAGDKWKATTDLLDLDDAHDSAVAWQGDRVIVVAPEDQRDRNPVTARVVVATGGKWKEIGVAKANVSPN